MESSTPPCSISFSPPGSSSAGRLSPAPTDSPAGILGRMAAASLINQNCAATIPRQENWTMKPLVLTSLSLLLVSPAFSQGQAPASQARLTREQVVQRVCRAPEIRSGAEFEEVRRIEGRLAS